MAGQRRTVGQGRRADVDVMARQVDGDGVRDTVHEQRACLFFCASSPRRHASSATSGASSMPAMLRKWTAGACAPCTSRRAAAKIGVLNSTSTSTTSNGWGETRFQRNVPSAPATVRNSEPGRI